MSVMKRQMFSKVRQIADQTFLRVDKSEVLNKELEQTEKRLDALKQPCLTLHKKMLACHQGAGQDTPEKRKKRIPEFALQSSMQECLETHLEGNILLWQVIEKCSELQGNLGDALLEEQMQAEKEVLATFHDFLEVDIPNVFKLRKQLFKLSQDMDTARTRYDMSVRHYQQAAGPTQLSAQQAKVDASREELEELTMRVEQARDTYAAELYALVSREPAICQSLVQWYEMQTAYHEKCLQLLNSSIPNLHKLIDQSDHHPLYGFSLESHLQCTGREIALVLEACVCCLLETALNEEGLFRIAGSASKVKKLKNALDAGVTNMYEYVTDPHSLAGALKSYLRALPEPLMTYAAYEDWIQADRIPDSDARLQRLWQVLNGLPKANYNNLRYLVKFLNCLCKNSEYNKMSSQNLSIVIAPNLLWSPTSQQSNHIGLNMTAANAHSSIVDTLISYCDWFFPDEVVFRLTMPAFPSPKGLLTPPVTEEGGGGSSISLKGIVNTAFEGANGESEESLCGSGQSPRVVHRPGKKPAPPVPLVLGSQGVEPSAESRSHLRASPPSQAGSVERSISRSSTLDRPGKPKRAPTRKSHDNLASLLPLDDTHLNNRTVIQHQPPGPKQEPEAVNVDVQQSSVSYVQSSQPAVNKEQSGLEGSVVNQFSSVKEQNLENKTSFTVDSSSRKEQNSQFFGHSVLRKDEAQPMPEPQPVPRKERDLAKPKTEGLVNAAVAISVSNTSDSSSGNLADSHGTNMQKSGLPETKFRETKTASHNVKQLAANTDANVDQPDVPFTQAIATTRRKDAIENVPAILDPSTKPVYENVSSEVKVSVQQSPLVEADDPIPQVVLQGQDRKGDQVSVEKQRSEVVIRSEEVQEKETKPQVPCKPAALSTDLRNMQDNTGQVRSSENSSCLPGGEEQGSRGNGDKWHFLTSGQGVDKIPERPPKVIPPEGAESGEGKKLSPSPLARVKPPRPQPPLPPAKPKVNNDAEDTRL